MRNRYILLLFFVGAFLILGGIGMKVFQVFFANIIIAAGVIIEFFSSFFVILKLSQPHSSSRGHA